MYPTCLSCHGEITWQLLISSYCRAELLGEMAPGYALALVGPLRAVYICGNTWVQMTNNRKACARSVSTPFCPKKERALSKSPNLVLKARTTCFADEVA